MEINIERLINRAYQCKWIQNNIDPHYGIMYTAHIEDFKLKLYYLVSTRPFMLIVSHGSQEVLRMDDVGELFLHVDSIRKKKIEEKEKQTEERRRALLKKLDSIICS